jgi:hypothetical protein
VVVGQFHLQMFACQEDMEINRPATIPIACTQLRDDFNWPKARIDTNCIADLIPAFVPRDGSASR